MARPPFGTQHLLANLIDDALAGLAADAALRDKLDGWCKQVIHHLSNKITR